MSTQVTGRVVDENASPLAGLHVEVVDTSQLFDATLGGADTQAPGTFSITYGSDSLSAQYGPRRLTVRVWSHAHRLLHEVVQADGPTPVLALGDVTIPPEQAPGFAVTLGQKGPVQRLSHGNAVQFLVDDLEAWRVAADTIAAATQSVDIMQLELEIPRFDPDPARERSEIVLKFGQPDLDADDLRKVDDNVDVRLERLLLKRAKDGLTVRILISEAQLWTALPFILLALLLLIFPFTTFKIVNLIGTALKLLFRSLGDGKQGGGLGRVRDYFEAAGEPDVHVLGFPTVVVSVVHAKLVLTDSPTTSARALVIGSPFIQGYYDGPNHLIDDPRRGSGVEVPIHDVSMAVRGPAVEDMHAAFRLHWELVSNEGPEIMPAQPAAANLQSEESPATMQLVRTLPGGVFPAPLEDGEKGILEAYLRAIEKAQTFIYLENQYFTNFTIGDALVAALKATPQLRVIVLCNISPDVPFYPNFQRELIARMRDHAGADANRMGFFTAWSHEEPSQPNHPKPRIMANYLHTKVGIVDDAWVTIGSANLDGASLDAMQLVFPVFKFGSWRNHELNYTIFDDTGGANAPAPGRLRRMLWSEHLGMLESDLMAPPQGEDWLQVWRDAAAQKLAGLKSDPNLASPARILEFPDPPVTGDPGEYLHKLGAITPGIEVVEAVRFFSFKEGTWKR